MKNPYLENLNKIEFVVTYACTGRCKHCAEGEHASCGERIDPQIATEAKKCSLPIRLQPAWLVSAVDDNNKTFKGIGEISDAFFVEKLFVQIQIIFAKLLVFFGKICYNLVVIQIC